MPQSRMISMIQRFQLKGIACFSQFVHIKGSAMDHIRAIGFDLFNTLITAERDTLIDAISRLAKSLANSGVDLDFDVFKKAHGEAAARFFKQARQDGRETHNRFWISSALETQGYRIPPDDTRISNAVTAYFSAFYEHVHLIPDTIDMLETLREKYALGLLSNFTHAPAAMEIINRLGLTPLFNVILISGAIGYRKPHPLVFDKLIDQLDVEKTQALFVGDEPDADIQGAIRAGIQPVWTTYAKKNMKASPPIMPPDPIEMPDNTVLRISTWQEFLALLDV